MISPETLRRYPAFGSLDFNQIKEIAQISETVTFSKGETILNECDPADSLYLIIDGLVDLYYRSTSDETNRPPKELNAGEISPGEFLGISSVIAPSMYNATARASKDTRAIKIDSTELRKLCDNDSLLGYRIMTKLAQEAIERLIAVRVQLAAAWS